MDICAMQRKAMHLLHGENAGIRGDRKTGWRATRGAKAPTRRTMPTLAINRAQNRLRKQASAFPTNKIVLLMFLCNIGRHKEESSEIFNHSTSVRTEWGIRMTRELKIDVAPPERELERITKQAEEIQARLSDLKTPVIIEFSGSPKSGKTTNIDIIEHFFKRSKFKVWAPSEGASKRTPYNLRKDLVAFNAWSLNYAISELLLSYHNIDMPHLVILDRGPFDSLAWMRVLQQSDKLSKSDYDTIRNFALLPKWADVIDRIYLFTCAPDTSLERENALKLTERSGLAMNSQMLQNLLTQYTSLAAEESAYPVVTVSTNNTTGKDGPKNSAFAIVSDLLECFSARLNGQK